MAATLTADQQALTYFSFPIEKREDTPEINPVDGTPDLWIWGKATDGTIDGDREIVDPEWSAKALIQWCDTGGNVRMAHDPKMPVGKGHEVHVTADGHYVRSKICHPLAKHLIRQGVLNDYSVGISNPDFRYGDRKLDPEGKALRVITGKPDGSSRIAELTVCDRGSNFNSRFSVVKSAGGFIGQMVGDEDEIAKVAPASLVKTTREEEPVVNVDLPKSASITFSPADLAKLLEHRRVAEERERAEKRNFDRNVGGGVDRDKIPAEDFAGRNRSFPIVTAADVDDALRSIGRAGADNCDAATLRRNILRIARRKGFPVPPSAGDSKKAARPGKKCKLCQGAGKIRDGAMTCPRCHGDGTRSPGERDEHGKTATAEGAPVTDDEAAKGAVAMPPATGTPPQVAKDDGGDEHEPVLHHDDGQDDDTDSDADANDKTADGTTAKAAVPGRKPKIPCPECKARCKPGAKFCGKCGCAMGTAEKASKPVPDGGAAGAAAHDIQPAPEHREPDGPAIEALEHDAHLPTVPDASVKAAMRLRDLGVPLEHGRLHDLLCPAYADAAVKAAWPGADFSLIDEMTWQAKALEIAASAPLEEAREAAKVWQSAITLKAVTPDLAADIMDEARKAFRDANPGPGSAPSPGEISAQRYNRPYISAGHSAPSPDHGAPHRDPVHAGHISASDYTRDLITAGHAADSPENATPRPAPVPAPEVPGVPSRVFYTNSMRQNARQAMASMHDHIAMTFPDLCPMHGPGRMGEPPSHARPVPVGAGGPVPHGASTKADEAARAEGYDGVIDTGLVKRLAKKELRRIGKAVLAGEAIDVPEARRRLGYEPVSLKAATGQAFPGEAVTLDAAPAVDPQVIKTAVAEATAPLLEKLAALEAADAEHKRMLDAIASQPDPAVTAYRGAALTKTTAAPAGPVGIQQRAALAQEHFVHDRIDTARNSPDPGQRLQAMFDLMEVHGLTGAKT